MPIYFTENLMNFEISQVNKRIARQVYFNYLIKSFMMPLFISTIYIICALIISKYFFSKMPFWYWLVLLTPVIILIGYNFYISRKLFFSEEELSAYIDYKTSSEGMYLTAYELNVKLEEKNQMQLLEKTSLVLPLRIPWRFLIIYIAIFTFFIFILLKLPATFLSMGGETGELLAVEKAMLEDLKTAKIIEPELAAQIQEEIDKLKEKFKENGIDKENWEKKQSIGQMLNEKLQEQQKIQEKIQNQMEQLEKKINSSEKLEELAKEMHLLEANLALNEFAKQTDEFQKASTEIQQVLSLKKDMLSGANLDLNQKLKALQALKEITKEMQKQQNARRACTASESSGQKPSDKEGEKDLANKLSALAERLDKEAKECIGVAESESDEPGKGGVSRGRGDAKLNLTNQSEPALIPLNLEKLNQGGQFNTEGEVVDISEGKQDKYTLDTQKNESRKFQNTETDLVNNQKTIPNRRDVIKKYFKRQSTQEK